MVKTISNTDLKDCPCKGARISFDKSVEEFTTQVIGENDREDRNEWNLTALCYEEKKKERGKKMKKKEGGGMPEPLSSGMTVLMLKPSPLGATPEAHTERVISLK